MGVGEARIGGVAMGVAVGVAGGASRVWLGERLGCGWGTPGVQIWCGCGADECVWEFLGPRWDRSPMFSQVGRSLGGSG